MLYDINDKIDSICNTTIDKQDIIDCETDIITVDYNHLFTIGTDNYSLLKPIKHLTDDEINDIEKFYRTFQEKNHIFRFISQDRTLKDILSSLNKEDYIFISVTKMLDSIGSVAYIKYELIPYDLHFFSNKFLVDSIVNLECLTKSIGVIFDTLPIITFKDFYNTLIKKLNTNDYAI